jgi:hypothetical protein
MTRDKCDHPRPLGCYREVVEVVTHTHGLATHLLNYAPPLLLAPLLGVWLTRLNSFFGGLKKTCPLDILPTTRVRHPFGLISSIDITTRSSHDSTQGMDWVRRVVNSRA